MLGRAYCEREEGESLWLDLSLVQSGGSVAGEVVISGTRILVAGGAASNVLQLGGAVIHSDSLPATMIRLDDFTASADQFGRLTGRFVHHEERRGADGSLLRSTEYEASLTLLRVVQ